MSGDLMKVAEQYDAAGRFMARGFVDEFSKLAHNLGLDLEKDAGAARLLRRAKKVREAGSARRAAKEQEQFVSGALSSGSSRLGRRAKAKAKAKAEGAPAPAPAPQSRPSSSPSAPPSPPPGTTPPTGAMDEVLRRRLMLAAAGAGGFGLGKAL